MADRELNLLGETDALREELRALWKARSSDIREAGARAWNQIVSEMERHYKACAELTGSVSPRPCHPAYQVALELVRRVERWSRGIFSFGNDDPAALEFVAFLMAALLLDVPESELGLPAMQDASTWRAVTKPREDTPATLLNNRGGILDYGEFDSDVDLASRLVEVAWSVAKALHVEGEGEAEVDGMDVAGRSGGASSDQASGVSPDLVGADAIADIATDRSDGEGGAHEHPGEKGLPRDKNIFYRHGDSWQVVFAGQAIAPLKHQVGFEYLCNLLAYPHHSISVHELEGSVAQFLEPEPTVDRDAVKAYVRQKQQLEAQLEGDLEPGVEVQAKKDLYSIDAELRRAKGHGRRARYVHEREKARGRVKEALRRALKTLAEEHPRLAEHLQDHLRTPSGVSPRFEPPSDVIWKTAPDPAP